MGTKSTNFMVYKAKTMSVTNTSFSICCERLRGTSYRFVPLILFMLNSNPKRVQLTTITCFCIDFYIDEAYATLKREINNKSDKIQFK